jgi:release factor glutamine methyltransferase
MLVRELLQAARHLGVDALDAQWLLGHHLQRPRTWLLAHDDHTLPAALVATLLDQLTSRAAGVPLAYLTGEREFCGLRLQVNPDVLIPRPETEGLVDWALSLLPAASSVQVADLGTGSGALALALAARRPGLRITATDASAAALAVAADNARRLGAAIDTVLGPWWAPLAGRRFELVVSNPPYVAEGDPHLPALCHEPRSALTAGADGLDDLRAIIAGAPAHLAPGGWLLLEHGHDQGQAVTALLAAQGFEALQTRHDLAGLARCTGGRYRHI